MNAQPSSVSVNVTATPSVGRVADLRVVVVLTNEGPSAVQLNMLALRSASTALKVKGPDQVAVRPGPPPVPPIDDGQMGRQLLEPGQSITLQYRGHDFAAGRPLPSGTYQAMFRYQNTTAARGDWVGTIESVWVPFNVGPG